MTDAAINYNYMMIFLKDLNNFIKKYQTILTKIKKKTYNYLIKLFYKIFNNKKMNLIKINLIITSKKLSFNK
jgi:hypothetical protein